MRRGRPEKLTKNVLDEVIRIRNEHSGWTAGQIRGELRSYLASQTKKNHPEWTDKEIYNEVDDVHLPGLSTVQKYLKKVKHGPSPLDNPWSLGSLIEHEIPPDLVPLVMALNFGLQGQEQCLTIRQAKWIVRLSGLPFFRNGKNDDGQLLAWARAFALREQVCELSVLDFDSSELDTGLFVSIFDSNVSLEFIKWLAQVQPGLISNDVKTSLAQYTERHNRIQFYGKGVDSLVDCNGIARLYYVVCWNALAEEVVRHKLTEVQSDILVKRLKDFISENQDKLETGAGLLPPEALFRKIAISDIKQERG
jgi:hypothetical protein